MIVLVLVLLFFVLVAFIVWKYDSGRLQHAHRRFSEIVDACNAVRSRCKWAFLTCRDQSSQDRRIGGHHSLKPLQRHGVDAVWIRAGALLVRREIELPVITQSPRVPVIRTGGFFLAVKLAQVVLLRIHVNLSVPFASCLHPADPNVLRRLRARSSALLDQRFIRLPYRLDLLFGRSLASLLILLVLVLVIVVLLVLLLRRRLLLLCLLLLRSWEVEPVPLLLGVQPRLRVERPRGLCFVVERAQRLGVPVYCDVHSPYAPGRIPADAIEWR